VLGLEYGQDGHDYGGNGACKEFHDLFLHRGRGERKGYFDYFSAVYAVITPGLDRGLGRAARVCGEPVAWGWLWRPEFITACWLQAGVRMKPVKGQGRVHAGCLAPRGVGGRAVRVRPRTTTYGQAATRHSCPDRTALRDRAAGLFRREGPPPVVRATHLCTINIETIN
jgi:hypothetical protein